MSEILVALILLIILSTLAIWIWKIHTGKDKPDSHDDIEGEAMAPESPCPLCEKMLPRGVKVRSLLFPGKEFDLMRIHGCPYCWADYDKKNPRKDLRRRLCPYCGNEVPKDGYVMARVYRKPHRKTHVTVYGCTGCKSGRG